MSASSVGIIHAGKRVESTNPLPVTPGISSADPGFTNYRNTALSATKQAVVAAACALWGVNLINVNTSPVYLKCYDALAADVTVGTTTPVLTLVVPAGDGTTPGALLITPDVLPVRAFATGLTIACVTGLADNSTAAPTTAIHCGLLTK